MPREREYLIGVDAGTTGLKSLAFDLSGNLIAKAYREYSLHHPRPDWAEQDPNEWWDALVETLRELLDHGKISASQVAGISISCQGSTVVAMGQEGRLLRPAISWLDKRAAEISRDEDWEEEELFSITGLRFSPAWTGPILHWLALNEPETVRQTHKFLLVGDYLIYRLSQAISTDYSSASRTRLFDVRHQRWSEGILSMTGVSQDQLPDLAGSGQRAGRVSAEGARATGLLQGTPVILGGFDQMCAALGAGAITPDTLMVSLGTATMLVVTSLEPLVDPERRLTTSCHVLPQAWTLQAPIMTTGALLRWWRDQFFHGHTDYPYQEMDELGARVPIGSDGLLVFPHFSGGGAPWWDHTRRGAFIGLSLSHRAPHFIRAMLEGVAMEIRANVEVAESLGVQIDSLRIAGGGAKSRLWREIIGDALGKPQIRLRELEVGALGAAILAGVGAGVFPDARTGVQAMVVSGEFRDFSPANHTEYLRLYSNYETWGSRLYGSNHMEQVPADAGTGSEFNL